MEWRAGPTMILGALLAFVGALDAAAFVPVGFPLIFTKDSRRDVCDAVKEDPSIEELARGTIALFKSDDVKIKGDAAIVKVRPFLFVPDDRNSNFSLDLASDERFRGQPEGAFCSAALIGPDLVLTDSHCVRMEDQCKATKFVFDFAIARKGALVILDDPDDGKHVTLPASSVYSCLAVLAVDQSGSADWALIELDHVVSDRDHLFLSEVAPEEGTEVFSINYPDGLPAKVTGKTRLIRSSSPSPELLAAHLDGSHGSSGGPIFNAASHKIEGVMMDNLAYMSQGLKDYVHQCSQQGGCRAKSQVIQPTPRNAFNATKVSGIIDQIHPYLQFDGMESH